MAASQASIADTLRYADVTRGCMFFSSGIMAMQMHDLASHRRHETGT
jgi:hypothetical protein